MKSPTRGVLSSCYFHHRRLRSNPTRIYFFFMNKLGASRFLALMGCSRGEFAGDDFNGNPDREDGLEKPSLPFRGFGSFPGESVMPFVVEGAGFGILGGGEMSLSSSSTTR